MAERISHDSERNTLFINYEGFQVHTTDDVKLVRRQFEERSRAIRQRWRWSSTTTASPSTRRSATLTS